MPRERLRIGTPTFVNETELRKTAGFDVLFDKYYEFVYIPDFTPWQPTTNGTWQGAPGHIQRDNWKWIECRNMRKSF